MTLFPLAHRLANPPQNLLLIRHLSILILIHPDNLRTGLLISLRGISLRLAGRSGSRRRRSRLVFLGLAGLSLGLLAAGRGLGLADLLLDQLEHGVAELGGFGFEVLDGEDGVFVGGELVLCCGLLLEPGGDFGVELADGGEVLVGVGRESCRGGSL